MNISNNFNFLRNNFTQIHHKDNSSHNNQDIIKNSTPAICNQYFYQPHNNISFGKANENPELPSYLILKDNKRGSSKILGILTLDSGEKVTITLSKNIIEKFLTQNNGELDKNSIQKFLSIYKIILQEITNQENKEKQFLEAVAKGESPRTPIDNVSYLNPQDDLRNSILSSLSEPSDNFIYSFFNGIKDDKLRQNFAKKFLSQYNQAPQSRFDKAMQRTSCVFEICKTQEGYDFSNIEQKIQIAIKLEDIKRNYGVIDIEEDLTSDIIQHSKDKTGKFNIGFAQALIELIKNSNSFIPDKLVKHRSDIINIFSAMDSNKQNEITDTIVKLSSVLEIDDTNNNFEAALIQIFNPVTGNFDEKAAELLLELAPLVTEATESLPIETKEDYSRYLQRQRKLIRDYFKIIRNDETGEIKQNSISPEEYIRQYINN